ncbi:MAG: hypothetical protein ACK4FJ_18705 [Ferrovibrio sp.]|uniref:hypothetical protein n=1 Tax=Ferrovibrio sp. TaxID=1917215 RepID=UPI00391D19BB
MKHIQTFQIYEAENGLVIRKGEDFARQNPGETMIANDISEMVNLIAHEVAAKTNPPAKVKLRRSPAQIIRDMERNREP